MTCVFVQSKWSNESKSRDRHSTKQVQLTLESKITRIFTGEGYPTDLFLSRAAGTGTVVKMGSHGSSENG